MVRRRGLPAAVALRYCESSHYQACAVWQLQLQLQHAAALCLSCSRPRRAGQHPAASPCLRLLVAGVHQLHKQVVAVEEVGQAVAVHHLRGRGRGIKEAQATFWWLPRRPQGGDAANIGEGDQATGLQAFRWAAAAMPEAPAHRQLLPCSRAWLREEAWVRLRLMPEYQRKLREMSNCEEQGTGERGRQEQGQGEEGRLSTPGGCAAGEGSRRDTRSSGSGASGSPLGRPACHYVLHSPNPPWCLRGSGWTKRWKCPLAPAGGREAGRPGQRGRVEGTAAAVWHAPQACAAGTPAGSRAGDVLGTKRMQPKRAAGWRGSSGRQLGSHASHSPVHKQPQPPTWLSQISWYLGAPA